MRAIIVSVLVFISNPALAQIYDIDSDQWDKTDLVYPEAFDESIIFGGDPRWEDYTAWNKNTVIGKTGLSVGRLKVQYGTDAGLCSAFLIGVNIIMTNYHCIPGRNEDAKKALLEMGYDAQFGGASGYKVNVSPLASNKDLDYTILEVEGRPGDEWGFLELSEKSVTPGDDLYIVHHPAGLPKKVSRVGCFAGEKAGMPATNLLHQCDTMGGSSGSPIFTPEGLVVGIHFSGTPDRGTNAFNIGTRISSMDGNALAFSGSEMVEVSDPATAALQPQHSASGWVLLGNYNASTQRWDTINSILPEPWIDLPTYIESAREKNNMQYGNSTTTDPFNLTDAGKIYASGRTLAPTTGVEILTDLGADAVISGTTSEIYSYLPSDIRIVRTASQGVKVYLYVTPYG